MKPVKVSLAVLLILALSNCGASTVINNLQLALDAVTAALPVIASITGVPPATVAQVTKYLDDVNTALGQASMILSATATDAEKAAKITQIFTAIVKPDVPAQYQPIVGLVGTIAQDVAQFLSSLPTSPSGTTSLSAQQRTQLAKITRQTVANKPTIQQLMLKK
jgi:hypothetical protein